MNIAELHIKALEHADNAVVYKFKGDKIAAEMELEKAFNFERSAALLAVTEKVGEPSQSILLRSAASLAINCGSLREAERLISIALSYEPPLDIADELRNLLEEVNFDRHLNLQGIHLDESELQLVIAGKSIGYGMARSREVWDRLNSFEKLTLRTVERRLGKPFREKGGFEKQVRERYQQYLSLPRAASFSFTIRIGDASSQLSIPGSHHSVEIIDEIIDNFTLLNNSEEEILKTRINSDPYYRNFLLLSKEIAPDGNDVSLVGITVVRNGQEKRAQLTRRKNDFSTAIQTIDFGDGLGDSNQPLEFSGTLSWADSEHHKIKLFDSSGKKHSITVPEGLGDIVRNYWEDQVIIKCLMTKKGLQLIDLNKA